MQWEFLRWHVCSFPVQILIAVVLGVMWSKNLPDIHPRFHFFDLFCGEAQASRAASHAWADSFSACWIALGSLCTQIISIIFGFENCLGKLGGILWHPLTNSVPLVSGPWIFVLHLDCCCLVYIGLRTAAKLIGFRHLPVRPGWPFTPSCVYMCKAFAFSGLAVPAGECQHGALRNAVTLTPMVHKNWVLSLMPTKRLPCARVAYSGM